MNGFPINFLRLTRPLSNVKNIALILLVFYLSGQEFDLYKFILGTLSLSFICSAVYAYNTLCDSEFDKDNKNKKHYSQAVNYFGKKQVLIIALILVITGIFISFYFNYYFLTSLSALLIIGYFYSSKRFRFKDKIILDVLFGAVFPFVFRFLSAWFVFGDCPWSVPGLSLVCPWSVPGLSPLVPLVAVAGLVFAKTAGYLLYKEKDRSYLQKTNIRNSVTSLKKGTVILLSVLCWIAAVTSLSVVLPEKFLFLITLAAPPLLVIYLSVLGIIKTEIKRLRVFGFIYWILVIIAILPFLFL